MALLLAIIYVVFVSLGLPDSLFGVAWPVVHIEFGMEESFASLYSVITAICTGGVSFIAGWFIRKLGTGKVTFFSTLLTVFGLLIISISPNIIVMLIGSIVLGYGAGVIDTALNNFVSLHYKSQHMNWLHASWGLGVTISPLVMSLFLTGEEGEWRNGYRVIALMQFSIALLILFSLKKWKMAGDTYTEEESSSERKSIIELFKIRGVIPSVLSQGLYCGMEFLIGTWGATFLVNVHSLAPDEAAKWISLYYGGIMLGRVISGFISMKASDNTMIRLGIFVSFLGIVLLSLPVGNIAFFGLLLIGIGFGPIFPSVLHSVPDRFGKEYSADITGFHMGGAYGIGFAISLSFGYIATATTFEITTIVLSIVCIALFLVNEGTVRMLKKS